MRIDADALDASLPPPPQQQLLTGIRATEPTTIQMDLGPALQRRSAPRRRFRAARPRSSPSSCSPPARTSSAAASASAPGGATADTTAPGAPAAPAAPVAPTGDLPVFGGAARPTIRTIVIDPGHGGEDNGVKGAGGATRERCDAGSRAPCESGDRRTPRHARAADARRRQPRRRRRARRDREQQQGRLVHQPARQRIAAADRARRRSFTR